MKLRRCPRFPLIRLSRIAVFLCSIVLGTSCSGSLTVDNEDRPASNLAMIDLLAKRTVESMARELGVSSSDTCSVSFAPSGDFQYLEHLFVASLGRTCSAVIVGDSVGKPSVSFEIQALRADIEYLGSGRTGLFGDRRIERVATVAFSAKVVAPRSGGIIFAGIRQGAARDTITAAWAERMESEPVPSVRQGAPPDTFLERILEPVVILVATGVIVYLFFTVRS